VLNTLSLITAATAARKAAETHVDACGTCHPDSFLGELCEAGQQVVTAAARQAAPELLAGPCSHTSWEVTSEYRAPDGSGWVKLRKCADCGDPMPSRTEPDSHWPAAALIADEEDAPVDGAQPFVPRTERSYWVAIADALNSAQAAGMPVGIDLDGTLTDRNMWSVVWDRDAERWTVAGYGGDENAEAGDAR
jgi:hypothetical protein